MLLNANLLPTNVVTSVVRLPGALYSMQPTLTPTALHLSSSTHKILTRTSNSFSSNSLSSLLNSQDSNLPNNPSNNLLNNPDNNLDNPASLTISFHRTNSLPKTLNSLPLDNSNSLPPNSNSRLLLNHNSLL